MENTLYLEASRDSDSLKIGVHLPDHSMSSYEEVSVCLKRIEKQSRLMIEALNKMGRDGNTEAGLKNLKKVGRLLCDELLPNDIKHYLQTTTAKYLILRLDDRLVHIPWELIYDGHHFLSERFSIGRLVKTRQKKRVNKERQWSKIKKLWIIANPGNDLPYSRKEGWDIFNYTDQNGPEKHLFSSILDYRVNEDRINLQFKDFDMVHFAGHAEYEPHKQNESGWKLTKGFFRASDIYKMAGGAPMPSLVFSNACQSARTEQWEVDKFTSETSFGLANAFLFSGVKHYIGPFWEILDRPGSQFALTFYEHLLSGKSIGESVKLTRHELMKQSNDPSWASYLLYGDPRVHYIGQQEVIQKIHDTDQNEYDKQNKIRSETLSETQACRNKTSNARHRLWSMGIVFICLIGLLAYFLYDYRNSLNPTSEDTWTSRPLSIAVVASNSFKSAFNQSKVNFIASVIESQIKQYPRITLVDRSKLDIIIKEYQLWKSEWHKPKNHIKPNLREATLFLILSIHHTDNQPFVVMHLEDTITGDVKEIFHEPIENQKLLFDQKERLSKKLLDHLKKEYPLRGKIIEVKSDSARLNIGYRLGVKNGQIFKVIDKKITLKVVSVASEESTVEIEKEVIVNVGWLVELFISESLNEK